MGLFNQIKSIFGSSEIVAPEEPRTAAQQLSYKEVLLLEYCNKGKYPTSDQVYPKFWLSDYGIANVSKMLSSLENRGYIEMANGKYSLTATGIEEVNARPYVLFMHQNKVIMPFSIPELERRIKGNSRSNFRDVIWIEYQQQHMQHAREGNNSFMFIDNFNMGNFLVKENRFKEAIPFFAQAIYIDINQYKTPPATGNIKSICTCIKKGNVSDEELLDILAHGMKDNYIGKHKYSSEDVAKKIIRLVKAEKKTAQKSGLDK